MRILPATLFAALLLSSMANAEAATIYKWVDAQGRTHFGSQPPAGLESQRLTTTSRPAVTGTSPLSGQPSESADSPSQKEIDAKIKRQVAIEQAELQAYCTDMRTRLSQLKNNPRLLAEVDGQMVRLSEEERQGRILEAESKISEFCSER